MNLTNSNNAMLQALLRALPDTVMLVDEDGYCVSAAASATDGPRASRGDSLESLRPRQITNTLTSALHKALRENTTQVREYPLEEDGESERWFEARLSPIPTKRREPRQVILVEREITLRKQLEAARLTDPVTGLSNQRNFMLTLDREVHRQERYDEPICLLLIEIEHYDALREAYGTDVGNACLRETARLVGQQLRHSDVFARLEDAEFGILLINTTLPWAKEVAARISGRIARTPLALPQKTLRLTLTGGVTDFHSGDTASSLLCRTEEALYAGEHSSAGGIRVV